MSLDVIQMSTSKGNQILFFQKIRSIYNHVTLIMFFSPSQSAVQTVANLSVRDANGKVKKKNKFPCNSANLGSSGGVFLLYQQRSFPYSSKLLFWDTSRVSSSWHSKNHCHRYHYRY